MAVKKPYDDRHISFKRFCEISNIDANKIVCIYQNDKTDTIEALKNARENYTQIFTRAAWILGSLNVSMEHFNIHKRFAWIWVEFENKEDMTAFMLKW